MVGGVGLVVGEVGQYHKHGLSQNPRQWNCMELPPPVGVPLDYMNRKYSNIRLLSIQIYELFHSIIRNTTHKYTNKSVWGLGFVLGEGTHQRERMRNGGKKRKMARCNADTCVRSGDISSCTCFRWIADTMDKNIVLLITYAHIQYV